MILTHIVQLFSKAYSLLKDLPSPSNRTALYIAYRIAETYNLSGQHEMAIRFFDRISHSFKNEKWTELVQGIRKMWYESAKAAGSVDGVGKLLLEMMCAGMCGTDHAVELGTECLLFRKRDQ